MSTLLTISCLFAPAFWDQFSRLRSTNIITNGIGYDYYSVMHYSAYTFSRYGAPTIIPKDSSVRLGDLGLQQSFSDKDLQHVNIVYCGGGK